MKTLREGAMVAPLSPREISISVIIAAAIFAFDLSTPLGVAGAVPYVVLVLVGLWSPWRPYVFVLALGSTVLIGFGYVFSPPGGVTWVAATNRTLALFAVWAMAILAFEHRRSEEARLDIEKRYRSLYMSTPAMMHSIDANGRILSTSDYWLEALGYDRDEVIGHDLVEFMTEASRTYALETSLPEFFRTGFVKDVEFQFVRKNGEVIDVLLSAISERDAFGRFVRSLAALNDVTERNRAQEALIRQSTELQDANAALKATLRQRETLLMELQHRVKNSLQVVVSLLNLRSDRAQDSTAREAIREASQRVEALSLAHRFFYDPDHPEQTALSEYIPALCRMLSQVYATEDDRVEVDIDVAPVTIPLSKISPVSLILNELVSNAVKHAFPGNRRGTVSVRFHRESHDDGTQVGHLCVADDGIGLPEGLDLGAATSMGLTIFRSLVDQIDGTFEIDRGQGTAIHLRFPLEVLAIDR